MAYKAVGRSINYAAPIWSTNLRDTNYRNIQYKKLPTVRVEPFTMRTLSLTFIGNEALWIVTGCHKMSSMDHLHTEAKMLTVREHLELLSAHYLARCLEPGDVWNQQEMSATPMMLADNRKATFQAIHTNTVKDQKKNIVLDDLPHQIGQRLRKRPNQEGTRHPPTVKIRILQTPRLIQEQNKEGR